MTALTALNSAEPNHEAPTRMKTYSFELRFLTPAFLGDAEQNARWRSPPFKAQLRQWWRVAYAAHAGFKPSLEAVMRQQEGELFGNAWLQDGFRKSLVRLRLDRWQEGRLRKSQWSPLAAVRHPEVRQPVTSDLYLGYGPVVLPRGEQRVTLKANAAIQANETNALSLAVPQDKAELIEQALALMHWYGTVGGRSRNGWGSYELLPRAGTPALKVALPVRDWTMCLNWDWPHAIGEDERGPLVWQTEPHSDWRALMHTLANLKIGLRTQFRFNSGDNVPNPEFRHWLAYPVTRHSVSTWGRGLRLPNQMRFKVRVANNGQLIGVIFHMPHLPPPSFKPDRSVIEQVWRRVHAFLDAPAHKLSRIQGAQP